MAMSYAEKLLAEAIDTFLQQNAKLGLSIHDKRNAEDSLYRGAEHLHNQINDMFALKTANLVHADAVCSAFSKVHNFMYIDNPDFDHYFIDEMKARGVPSDEIESALDILRKMHDELAKEISVQSEPDAGYNPDMDDVMDTGSGAVDQEFEITGDWMTKPNTKFDRGDASPGKPL